MPLVAESDESETADVDFHFVRDANPVPRFFRQASEKHNGRTAHRLVIAGQVAHREAIEVRGGGVGILVVPGSDFFSPRAMASAR